MAQIQMYLYPHLSAHTLAVGRVGGPGVAANVLSQAVRDFGHICFYYYMHMLTFTKPTENGGGEWVFLLVQITFCIYDPSANAMDDKLFRSKNKIFCPPPPVNPPPPPPPKP